jgi:ribose transport system ATP-binding protein
MDHRLSMTGVSKRFGATQALKNVTLSVRPGQAHALIGENGAGKSTLMKILSGACTPDTGTIELDGVRFEPRDPHHAHRSGIAMIYQELNLAGHLSVEENILLGDEPSRWGWLDRRRRASLARAALAELHHDNIPLTAPVHACTIAEQQIVEIARALVTQPKVLIMDEPTSSLTQVDTGNLFRVIERLKQRGVSVIYISHFLEECQRVCERYTVLRDGASVRTGAIADTPLPDLVRAMVGRDVREIYPRTPRPLGGPVLELRSLAGTLKPTNVTLTVRRGEIFGVAGLIGAGRTETLRVCFGLDRLRAGAVAVFGRSRTRLSPNQRLAEGCGMLSENRKEEGLLLERSLADNLTLTRFSPLAKFGFVSRRRQHLTTKSWMQRLAVRARSPAQPVGELSGGNQQKVAFGRLLHHDAQLLLLDEPTRGIDVGSKAEIYRFMAELAASGKAILFVSSYLPELLGICDTIGIMCRGTIVAVRPAKDWTEHDIMSAAIGQPHRASAPATGP